MERLEFPIEKVRRLVLHSQHLNSRNRFGAGIEATAKAIVQLGYVQIDTLHVVARAHHHTLWNRLQGYRLNHVDKLQRQGHLFEHWAHALAILPMSDYRYSLPMMSRIAAGEIHWYPKNKKQTDYVLKRIREEGPLMAKDFEDKPESKAMWSRAPSKLALEQLFMEGELMIPHRVNFHKVYDLRERVLPAYVDTREPNKQELCHHLITRYLKANAIGQAKEMSYLRKGLGPLVRQTLLELQENGDVVEVQCQGQAYFVLPDTLEVSNGKLPPSGFRILSPFDNVVIQRKRTQSLFDFDYQIECYVKKENRQYGYFCLPLLYRNKIVGRLDAKADRQEGIFKLLHLHIEKPLGNKDSFYRAFISELRRFAQFNDCQHLALEEVSGCDEAAGYFSDHLTA